MKSIYDFNFNKMKTIAETRECETGNWIYRFDISDKGVAVNRVPVANPLWSHGHYNEAYSISENQFIPIIRSGLREYFPHISNALGAMSKAPGFYDGIDD